MDHPYTYIFIRTDIPFEQQLVQSSHAALEAGFEFDKPEKTSSIIVIPAKSQAELYKISDRLSTQNIKHKLFFEPDFNMGHSALATEPILCSEKRKVLKKFQLYKFRG
jgi:hypothetical protein